MPASRLRLRFSAAFALVLGVILALFVTAGVFQQWRASRRRLDERLVALAVAVDHALAQELAEHAASTLPVAAGSVVRRWPHEEDGFAVLDSTARPIAVRDPRGLATRALDARRVAAADRFDLPRDGDDGRAVQRRVVLASARASAERATVLVFDSSEDIERDIETLSAELLIAVPLLILLALAGGYVLSGRALRPMGRLGDAIDAIPPDDLSARLVMPARRDEVSALAERVNTLLERVEAARLRHQRFVREAAHQIRTPLTLVLGEAEYALGSVQATPGEADRALARVHVAAEQMRRRVDELMLFAEAESGTAFERADDVELDELAFECTDLMRRRAGALGRHLALGDLEPVTVRGNAALLREALLELLENALRHGGAAAPVTVATEIRAGEAHLFVRSARPPDGGAAKPGAGLGLPILDWIAAGHGGRYVGTIEGERFEARIVIPLPEPTGAATDPAPTAPGARGDRPPSHA